MAFPTHSSYKYCKVLVNNIPSFTHKHVIVRINCVLTWLSTKSYDHYDTNMIKMGCFCMTMYSINCDVCWLCGRSVWCLETFGGLGLLSTEYTGFDSWRTHTSFSITIARAQMMDRWWHCDYNNMYPLRSAVDDNINCLWYKIIMAHMLL